MSLHFNEFQATAASNPNFSIPDIAKALGYRNTQVAGTREEIIEAISNLSEPSKVQGPNLIEVKIARGSRKDLGR